MSFNLSNLFHNPASADHAPHNRISLDGEASPASSTASLNEAKVALVQAAFDALAGEHASSRDQEHLRQISSHLFQTLSRQNPAIFSFESIQHYFQNSSNLQAKELWTRLVARNGTLLTQALNAQQNNDFSHSVYSWVRQEAQSSRGSLAYTAFQNGSYSAALALVGQGLSQGLEEWKNRGVRLLHGDLESVTYNEINTDFISRTLSENFLSVLVSLKGESVVESELNSGGFRSLFTARDNFDALLNASLIGGNWNNFIGAISNHGASFLAAHVGRQSSDVRKALVSGALIGLVQGLAQTIIQAGDKTGTELLGLAPQMLW